MTQMEMFKQYEREKPKCSKCGARMKSENRQGLCQGCKKAVPRTAPVIK